MADALLRATGCDAQRRNSKSSAGYNDAEPHLFLQIWPFRIPNLDYPGHVVLNVWHTCFIDDESFRNNLKYNI